MPLFLLSLGLIAFILYFYGIGLWYLWFLPIIIIASFMSYQGLTSSLKTKTSEIFEKYSLYITWTIVLIGIVGILNFFGFELSKISMILIGINLLLWIWSYFTNYKDGKSVFQWGYYMSLLFLLLVSTAFSTNGEILKIFNYIRVFNFAVVWFICLVVWLYKEVESYMQYTLFIFGIGTIIIIITESTHNIYLWVAISILVLTGVFSLMFKILQQKPLTQEKKKSISVRRILAGERITEPKKYFNSKFIETIYEFTYNMPTTTKQILELINILLMFTVVVYYITHGQDFSHSNELLYWITIAFFIGNVLILKKAGYNSVIQNLAVFLVINFAVYISLFSYFEGNIWSMVVWWIWRNLLSSIGIFYAPKYMQHIFQKVDYIYRIITILVAMVINIILLIKSNITWQLVFFLVLLYLGIQSMIVYYALKYVLKLNEQKEDKTILS